MCSYQFFNIGMEMALLSKIVELGLCLVAIKVADVTNFKTTTQRIQGLGNCLYDSFGINLPNEFFIIYVI